MCVSASPPVTNIIEGMQLFKCCQPIVENAKNSETNFPHRQQAGRAIF